MKRKEKSIVLCADDYGQNPAISQAIIQLITKNRLSATSCMTASPYWREQAKALQKLDWAQVDIGLHFDLTEHALVGKVSPLSTLIVNAYFRRLKLADIEVELHAQLDQFSQGLGRLPDFIDGHQHIQQLPIVRDAILHVYEKRLRATNCYMRSVNDPDAWRHWSDSGYSKMLIIQLCGSAAWKKKLKQHQIPHNSSFSGAYDFRHAANYAQIFPHFLARVQQNGIIMCHPGLQAPDGQKDTIATARYHEYCYLLSDYFVETCQQRQICLAKFNRK